MILFYTVFYDLSFPLQIDDKYHPTIIPCRPLPTMSLALVLGIIAWSPPFPSAMCETNTAGEGDT